MNLTKRPPYQKGTLRVSKAKARPATKKERARWELIRALGCIVANALECYGRITIHHCGTGAGGRKDHGKVIPLCYGHHQGHNGIDGKRMSKRDWEVKYDTEIILMKRVERRIERDED